MSHFFLLPKVQIQCKNVLHELQQPNILLWKLTNKENECLNQTIPVLNDKLCKFSFSNECCDEISILRSNLLFTTCLVI